MTKHTETVEAIHMFMLEQRKVNEKTAADILHLQERLNTLERSLATMQCEQADMSDDRTDIKRLLTELTTRTASIEEKMDSWWNAGEQEDWTEHKRSDEIDFDEALGQVVTNELLGEESRAAKQLVPTDAPRLGEQGLLDGGWSEFDPLRPQISPTPSFGAREVSSRGPPLAQAALPAPSHAASHLADYSAQRLGTEVVAVGQSAAGLSLGSLGRQHLHRDATVAEFLVPTEMRQAPTWTTGAQNVTAASSGTAFSTLQPGGNLLPSALPAPAAAALTMQLDPGRGTGGPTGNAASHPFAGTGGGGAAGCGFQGHVPAFPGVCTGSASDQRTGAVPAATGAALNQGLSSPPGLPTTELDQQMNPQELSLLMKFFQTMGELPKLEYGSPSDRAERLQMWKLAMETTLRTTRPVVLQYWNFVVKAAEDMYQVWLDAPPMQRSQVKCLVGAPRRFEDIELYLHPRILAAVPSKLKDAVMQEKSIGLDITTSGVLFRLFTWMQPGGLEEHDALHKTLTSPNPCVQPQAALKELRRWFKAVQRAVQIGMQLPSLELLYRGARSIYAGAFEQDDFALRLRFTTEEQKWGFPHRLSYEGLQAINAFAEGELAALVLRGTSSINTSLPLTDTQRAREKGEKAAEKSRAAAARGAGAAEQTTTTTTPTANLITKDGVKYSATTSSWAKPCEAWDKTGVCSRGINCWFAHKGFPTHDKDNNPIQTLCNMRG